MAIKHVWQTYSLLLLLLFLVVIEIITIFVYLGSTVVL